MSSEKTHPSPSFGRNDLAVRVEQLGKMYRIGGPHASYGRLTESLWEMMRSPVRRLRRGSNAHFWALKDVSMEISSGEVVGIIGRNGAGKTTLLKVLSRITEPTEGFAELNGRVGSLLEVGTGFHPELTGKENIFLNGAILGMRRDEIRRRFDEILAFAGVEKFINTPVKRYSSGMQVRLAFAVAAHLEPEILIVDEVLAVGDAAFQKKCLGKMGEVATSGRTVLFVSHNMAAVENLCTTAFLLDEGRLITNGPVAKVVEEYLDIVRDAPQISLSERTDRQGTGSLRFKALVSDLRFGSSGEIRLQYAGDLPLNNVEISIGIFTTRGEGAAYLGNALTEESLDGLPSMGEIVCRLPKTALLPGVYSLNIYCTVNGVLADWIVNAARIDVAEGDFYGTGRVPLSGYGTVAMEHQWGVVELPDA